MKTFAALIDDLGGPVPVSIALGVADSHARTMKARDSVPVEHWPRLIAFASEKGVEGVSFEVLHQMRAARMASDLREAS